MQFIPRPLVGICYDPAPSDCTRLNCTQGPLDFCNEDFAALWRRDLPLIKKLGANFLRLFRWNPDLKHETFVAQCGRLGLRINVPIAIPASQWQDQNPDSIKEHVQRCVDDALRMTPVVCMYTITLTDTDNDDSVPAMDHIRFILESLHTYEQQRSVSTNQKLPIAVPIPMSGKTRQTLDQIFEAAQELGMADRLINCVSSFESGTEIQHFVEHEYGSGTAYGHIPLLIGQYGCSSDAAGSMGQALFVRDQCKAIMRLSRRPSSKPVKLTGKRQALKRFIEKHPFLERFARFFRSKKPRTSLVGGCLYTWVDSPLKPDHDTRRTMGVCALKPGDRTGRTASGDTYPIDELEMKPVYGAVARCVASR